MNSPRTRTTPRQWISEAALKLEAMGDPEARVQAGWMAADALDVSLSGLRIRMDQPMPPQALERAQGWLCERLTGKPLQYVQGCAWFMGHKFLVDERVLIPRQDTELLCERALHRCAPGKKALDLCTGSGAVGIAMKLFCPGLSVWLSDISDGALAVAGENARRLGAEVNLLQGDFFQAARGMTFDVIACNPPYLTDQDMASLQREVTFEPALALEGGPDGLDFYRRAAREAEKYLNPGGFLLLEVGEGQAPSVAELLGGGCTLHRDISGVQRVVEKQY